MPETPRVRTLRIRAPGWGGHQPGQHVDLRLTAEDGYQAVRSYSLAAPPDGDLVAVTVERLDDGEVSPFLVDELRAGDVLELRGPVGGYFTWQPTQHQPLALIGGGSGVVPLVAIIRARVATADGPPVRLLYSARSAEELIYRGELDDLAGGDPAFEVIYTLTREQPDEWSGYSRRIDETMLQETVWPADRDPIAYVCGPTTLVENVADLLDRLGYPRERIRTERFGPTGG
jgi:ferredoxin-NADP reductase